MPIPHELPVPWKLILSGMLDHRPEQRLDGAETAALLTTSAFSAPWDLSWASDTDRLDLPHDLVALAPPPGATARIAVGDPPVVPPKSSFTAKSRGYRRWWLAALGAVASVALLIGLAFGLGSNPASHRHKSTGATDVTRPHTAQRPLTSTSTSTSTSISISTIPSAPTALGTLVRDLVSPTGGETVGSATAQSISGPAEQAVSDEGAGKPNQAATDLQRAAQAITNAVQVGSISQTEGTTLESDLSTLAADLGLSAASTPPTTPSGPGNTGSGNTGNTGSGNTGNTGSGNTANGNSHHH